MKQKIKQTLMAIVGLLLSTTAFAHDFEVDGIYYNITDATAKTAAVTYCGSYAYEHPNEYMVSVTIPSSVTYSGITYSVTSIGYEAFCGCRGLTSITIPNSITSIDWYAFSGCTGLTSVTIPNSVTSIGSEVFRDCTSLTSMVVASGNSVYDSRDNCNAIIETAINTLIAGCKSTIISNSVTSIGDCAFEGCTGLTSVTIPNSVTEIGIGAFERCKGLTSVTIPNSVTSIDIGAFANCTGLTSVNIHNSVIGDCAFQCCTGLTSVTIPNSITLIGNSAFYGCTGLAEVNYNAENCTSMGSYDYPVFVDCSNLKTLNIGNEVKNIPRYAFRGCSGLTSVTIPNSVTLIGEYAFYDCGLSEVCSYNMTPPPCADGSFGGYANNSYSALLKVPADTKVTYSTAAEWCNFTNIIEFATVEVSTKENNATFEIPTTECATTYAVNVYSDEAMTQLVTTANYDATGKIIPMATSLELSIDGFEDGTYYYDIVAKSETGEILSSYTGSFEIDTDISDVENIATDDIIEVSRYDIHGRLLNKPTRGVNIVIYSDGSTRKEIVK